MKFKDIYKVITGDTRVCLIKNGNPIFRGEMKETFNMSNVDYYKTCIACFNLTVVELRNNQNVLEILVEEE